MQIGNQQEGGGTPIRDHGVLPLFTLIFKYEQINITYD